ncbi:unnamed protein product [Darwinula stevensoni]|uniref:WAP domain-containing protein n=1 Tax=Darwinula stevensoni TaxID=69355 RepID=A0A7R9A7R2_9CRUS|nr:unnamed protein product [Darwinula stevensoni]CAG0894588.1 unnamed protein product [Darwinula stevensoni]
MLTSNLSKQLENDFIPCAQMRRHLVLILAVMALVGHNFVTCQRQVGQRGQGGSQGGGPGGPGGSQGGGPGGPGGSQGGGPGGFGGGQGGAQGGPGSNQGGGQGGFGGSKDGGRGGPGANLARLPRCPWSVKGTCTVWCERHLDCHRGEICCFNGCGSSCSSYGESGRGVRCGGTRCDEGEKCISGQRDQCFRDCQSREVCVPKKMVTCESVKCPPGRACVNILEGDCRFGRCEGRSECIRRGGPRRP